MFRKAMGKAWLRLTGWRAEGDRPRHRKYVLIAAPHTSNWDLPHMLALAWSQDVHVQWAGKRAIFRFPFGTFMRLMGGLPVDRSRHTGLVGRIVEMIQEAEEIVLAVPPEGTRGRADYWKSGFYRIALGAGVPIYTGYLDYSRKRGGFGEPLEPTGDVAADMERIRARYRPEMARYPEKFQTPRLRAEEEGLEAGGEASTGPSKKARRAPTRASGHSTSGM